MLWVYLTLFAILNVYCLFLFHRTNQQLRQEILKTKQWCRDIIEDLLEQEKKIDDQLLQVINEIHNSNITNKIMDIRNDHSEKVTEIKDKFDNFPGDQ